MLCVTEKQYAGMEYIVGVGESDVLTTDERFGGTMMLAHPFLQSPIKFKENRVPVLIVENGQLFSAGSRRSSGTGNGRAGRVCAFRNAGLIEIGKNVQMTLNPLFPELDGTANCDKNSADGGDSGGGSAGENGGVPCRIE